MKFKDVLTGAMLETNNELVLNQYRKYADRYKEVKAKPETKETVKK